MKMGESVDKILGNEKNINVDFVVHVTSFEQLNSVITVLEKRNFVIQFKLFDETLRDWMMRTAKEDNYDTCFRIRNREDDKCVAYNPSIEHWRLYCNNIIEFEHGEIIFNEGKYTRLTAEIEAKKIINNIKEGEKVLEEKYGDKTEEQIIECLIEK